MLTRRPSRRAVLPSVMLALLAGAPGSALADGAEWGFSPGIKLGYTPGHGVTYGLEVSLVRVPDLLTNPSGNVLSDLVDTAGRVITRTWGIVFDVDTTFHGLVRLHMGAEWVGPFLGVESGPTMVNLNGRRHFGWGLTGWAGYDLYAYYTRTYVRHADNLGDFGLYLKTPLLSFRHGSSVRDFDDDN